MNDRYQVDGSCSKWLCQAGVLPVSAGSGIGLFQGTYLGHIETVHPG